MQSIKVLFLGAHIQKEGKYLRRGDIMSILARRLYPGVGVLAPFLSKFAHARHGSSRNFCKFNDSLDTSNDRRVSIPCERPTSPIIRNPYGWQRRSWKKLRIDSCHENEIIQAFQFR